MNSFRGKDKSSGLAYYKNMKFGGNDGQQPDSYVDIVHGSLLNWEGYHNGKAFREPVESISAPC